MAQIVDVHGNPIKTAPLREPQSADLINLRRTFSEHPSRGLDIRRLPRILEAAERGDLRAQSDLFCDMEERDGHIFAEMSKRRRALLTLDWSIKAPRNATAAEKDMAAAANEWFQDLPNFDEFILDMLDGIGHGFSPIEIEWNYTSKSRFWFPKAFHKRPQSWFRTQQDNRDELRLDDYSMYGAPLQPLGWVVHRHKAKAGYLPETGLHRVLCWPYLFKNFSVLDLADFLDIYGFPMRVGKYGNGATVRDKNTLLRALMHIGRDAAGIIPDEMAVEFHDAVKGDAKNFQVMIDFCDKTISKAVLGGTLTSQADGKTSTNALGGVHNEVRHDLMASDAKQTGGTLTRGVLYPLLVLNGYQVDPHRMPRFAFDTRELLDLTLFSEAMPALVSMMDIPASWAYEKTGIPQPQDGEPLLRAPTASTPTLQGETLPVAPASQQLPATIAALTQNVPDEAPPDPAQAAVDSAPGAVFAQSVSTAMNDMLAPLMAALSEGMPPEDAMEKLVELYPQLSTAELTQLTSQALFSMEIWGRINA